MRSAPLDGACCGAELEKSKPPLPLTMSPSSPSPLRKEEEGSVVMFGGVDHSYYSGDLNWVPVSRPFYWQLSMDR